MNELAFCLFKWADLFFPRHEVFIVLNVPDPPFPFRNVALKKSWASLPSLLDSWLTFSALAELQSVSMSKNCLYGQLASRFSYTWAYLLGTGQPPFFDKHFCAMTTKILPANCDLWWLMKVSHSFSHVSMASCKATGITETPVSRKTRREKPASATSKSLALANEAKIQDGSKKEENVCTLCYTKLRRVSAKIYEFRPKLWLVSKIVTKLRWKLHKLFVFTSAGVLHSCL